MFVYADARRDREAADVIRHAAVFGRDVIGQTIVGDVGRLLGLLAQVVPGHGHLAARFVGVNLDVVAPTFTNSHRVGREQAEHGIGGEPLFFDDLS